MPLVFEQQPNESAKAFEAFNVYLALGPTRSLAAVARKLGRDRSVLGRWSRQFHWLQRVRAHTAHLVGVERQAAETLAQEKGTDWAERYEVLREAEWQERQKVLELAAEVRRRWLEDPDRPGTPEAYVRLVELGSKLGHSACEKPTDRTELTGPDGGPLQIEVQAALKKIYGQPLPGEVVDVEEVSKAGDAATPKPLPAPTPMNVLTAQASHLNPQPSTI